MKETCRVPLNQATGGAKRLETPIAEGLVRRRLGHSSASATVSPYFRGAATDISPSRMLTTSATRRLAAHRCGDSGLSSAMAISSTAVSSRPSGWIQFRGEQATTARGQTSRGAWPRQRRWPAQTSRMIVQEPVQDGASVVDPLDDVNVGPGEREDRGGAHRYTSWPERLGRLEARSRPRRGR